MEKTFKNYMEFAVNYFPKLVKDKYLEMAKEEDFFYSFRRVLEGKTSEPSIEEIKEELIKLKQTHPQKYRKLEESLTEKTPSPFFNRKLVPHFTA